jgi:hypothetical protein
MASCAGISGTTPTSPPTYNQPVPQGLSAPHAPPPREAHRRTRCYRRDHRAEDAPTPKRKRKKVFVILFSQPRSKLPRHGLLRHPPLHDESTTYSCVGLPPETRRTTALYHQRLRPAPPRTLFQDRLFQERLLQDRLFQGRLFQDRLFQDRLRRQLAQTTPTASRRQHPLSIATCSSRRIQPHSAAHPRGSSLRTPQHSATLWWVHVLVEDAVTQRNPLVGSHPL